MKRQTIRFLSLWFMCAGLMLSGGDAAAQRRRAPTRTRPARARVVATPQTVLERDVRAHEEFLASDAMQGRGSGTQFELVAGQYVAAQLRQFGIEPAGDADASGQKSYLQTVALSRPA